MLPRPPEHRVDAPIIYVHPRDEAWDKARIEAECKQMEEAGEDPKRHPFAIYSGGYNRYDLDAEYTVLGDVARPRDYLDSDRATKWYLKRLEWQQWYEVEADWKAAIRQLKDPHTAYLKALVNGVQKVENGPKLEGPPNRLTDSDMRKIFAMRFMDGDVAVDPAIDLGEAVYTASSPLSEAEGKH